MRSRPNTIRSVIGSHCQRSLIANHLKGEKAINGMETEVLKIFKALLKRIDPSFRPKKESKDDKGGVECPSED